MCNKNTAMEKQLPEYDHAKKMLDYVFSINAANESRLNVFITLNIATIGALGFMYRSLDTSLPHNIKIILLVLVLLSILLFLFSLFLAIAASKSRIIDRNSPMITRWIVGEKTAPGTSKNAFKWLFKHLRKSKRDPNAEQHQRDFEEFLSKIKEGKSWDKEWETRSILRETFALSHAARSRIIGLGHVNKMFGWAVMMTALTFAFDIIARVVYLGPTNGQ